MRRWPSYHCSFNIKVQMNHGLWCMIITRFLGNLDGWLDTEQPPLLTVVLEGKVVVIVTTGV